MERYSPTIHLDLDEEPFKLVEVHPVVLFSILEQHVRRDDTNERNERVIGSLLGFFGTDGVVQITNCFTVPHKDLKQDQSALNMDFHRKMLNLHSTVSPHLQIVGWYSTAFNAASVLVHNFYAKEINRSPVYLLVDPSSLEKGNLTINCYYSMSVHFVDKTKQNPNRKNPDDKKLQEHFRPIRVVVKSSHGERTTLERLIETKESPVPPQLSNNLESVTAALNSLLEMINLVSSYVKDVAKGNKPGDIKIAHLIEDTLALLPIFESDRFENIFTKGLQDVLMIVYLANLTRTHLLIENIRVN
jgi:translation initiation factor 3 subunit F